MNHAPPSGRTSVLCVLPARIGSERLPRKPLHVLAGRTLVEWSWRAARRVEAFDEVWVATDAEEIAARVRDFGGHAVLTRADHASGTDRVAEAAASPRARGHDIVVNFQADEPFADPAAVGRAVELVRRAGAPAATVAAPVGSAEEWRSAGVVKVVTGAAGRALYFSRAPIPHPREGPVRFGTEPSTPYLRHVGVYAFRREVLERWVALPPSRLERLERLEQLRALENGIEIRVAVGPPTPPGVDAPEDAERAERLLATGRAGPDACERAQSRER